MKKLALIVALVVVVHFECVAAPQLAERFPPPHDGRLSARQQRRRL